MTKKEFLAAIRRGLRRCDDGEVAEISAYYDELISDMCDGGMTEKAAVASFGDMKSVLARIMGEMLEKPSQRSVWRTTSIIFGALMSPVLLPVLISAIAVYIVFTVVSFSLVVGFACGGVGSIIYGIVMFFAVMGSDGFLVALIYLGGGLVVGCVLCLLTIGLYKLSVTVLKTINGAVVRRIKNRKSNIGGNK